MMRSLLYRPVWLPAAVIGLVLVLALSVLVGTSWRSLQRLQPINTHLAHLYRLQHTGLRLQQALLASIDQQTPVSAEEIVELRHDVETLLAGDGNLVPDTPLRLAKVRAFLADLTRDPREALIFTLYEIRQILSGEIQAHEALVNGVARDAQLELRLSTGLTVGFPLLTVLLLFMLRRRILLPLENLRELMALLGRQEYRSASTADVDPLLRPVFANYNHMVGRLQELERQHQARQQSLEDSVRSATSALLQQQRELARAERLAAVGEVAAGLAHELRNPLAGIQVALSSLRRDTEDREHGERMDLVIGELRRVARLLNDLLSQSRQVPESPAEVHLATCASELLSLLRYQVPQGVHLQQDIPAGLRCYLPEGGLRQALLNLVLNAAQALGEQAGTITVNAHPAAAGKLRVSVCDDGPGFPAELLSGGVRAFATWRENGTGLGLATVRRFVRDIGGEMELGNRQPKGACVSLTLPCGESRV